MTTHSPTDLKPGDIVQHPEKGNGLVRRSRVKRDEVVVMQVVVGVDAVSVYDLTGWERVETIRPGHVQVRVDDLDPQTLSEWSQYAGCNLVETALLRVGCASIAHQVGQGDQPTQPTESTPPADEQPTSATVTLFCPDCGEAENVTVVMLGKQSNGQRWFDLREFHAHTCPPAQPDEPTEPGIHVSVCDMRLVSLMQNPTGGRLFADVKSGHIYDWGELTERGTVTLGWDDGEQP